MIARKTANKAINTTITGVVPQLGETFPYSEFRGFRRVPRLVDKDSPFFILFAGIVIKIKNEMLVFVFFKGIA
jgi:hypothetical protein